MAASSHRIQDRLSARRACWQGGRRLQRACMLRVRAQGSLDAHALYTRQTYNPPAVLHKVAPAIMPGVGLGMLATADIAAGELILVSRPLGVVYGPSGSLPSNDALVRAIRSGTLQPTDAKWLQLLRSPRQPRSDSSAGDSSQIHQPDLQASLQAAIQLLQGRDCTHLQPQEPSPPPPPPPSEGGSGNGVPLELSVVTDAEAVTEAVACNSYGEASEDVAVSALREVDPLGYVGLWPELALINHSCAPNTSQLMVGGSMLVRAAHPIMEGEEVTLGYLGRDRFMHVAQRRALLAAEYGFHCQCDRCLLEHHLFPTRRYAATDADEQRRARSLLSATSPSSPGSSTLDRVVQWVLDRTFGEGRFSVGASKQNSLLQGLNALLKGSLEASAQDALTALSRGTEQQEAVLQRIIAAISAVEANVEELALSRRDRLMVLASVGGLYFLRQELMEVSGLGSPQEQLHALRTACEVMDIAARGSDTHMFLTVKLQAKAKAVHGQGSTESNAAEVACAMAHVARYGRVDAGLLRDLVQVRARLAAGSAMASRISLMAWGEHKGSDNDGLQV